MLKKKYSVDSEDTPSLREQHPAMEAMKKGVFKGEREIAVQEKYKDLFPVEQYLQEVTKPKLQKHGIGLDYDCTAVEPFHFDTINYTTFAGMMIMHTFNFELSLRQMFEAHSAARGKYKGHVEYVAEQMQQHNNFSKYTFSEVVPAEAKKVLVVLSGGNKLKKHVCVGKIQEILDRFGRDNVLFKKHPVSYDNIYEELSEYLGGIHYADAYADLYALMRGSEHILTTFISESALVAKIMGKEIDHMDLLQNRETTSFGHINYFIFTMSDPLSWLDQAFSSPQSGVICPAIDRDWQQKIDQYIDYILSVRGFFKKGYVR